MSPPDGEAGIVQSVFYATGSYVLPDYRKVESNQEWEETTISFDAKTARSRKKMKAYEMPLRIVSAQFAELGLTFGQKAVEEKSNLAVALRRLALSSRRYYFFIQPSINCPGSRIQRGVMAVVPRRCP
ncbi:MAG: hypothetical protein IJQ81_15185 [Oscillibacter sp.]|nr:hypothetical protein [Oscillibacter sp.]